MAVSLTPSGNSGKSDSRIIRVVFLAMPEYRELEKMLGRFIFVAMIAFGLSIAWSTGNSEAAKKQPKTNYNFGTEQPAKVKAKKKKRQRNASSRSFFNFSFSSSSSKTRRGRYRGKQVVEYPTKHRPGTIIISTSKRKLFYVLPEGKAVQYGIGVGRQGFTWSGSHRVSRKKKWPGWTPPAAMRQRQPELPAHMEGGPNNPLGARAIYIGSTLYRIHGTNAPWTIGGAVSSGCIRLVNEEVIDLYDRVRVGARVVVN